MRNKIIENASHLSVKYTNSLSPALGVRFNVDDIASDINTLPYVSVQGVLQDEPECYNDLLDVMGNNQAKFLSGMFSKENTSLVTNDPKKLKKSDTWEDPLTNEEKDILSLYSIINNCDNLYGTRVKQLFLPLNDSYIVVTPTESAGMLLVLHNKLKKHKNEVAEKERIVLEQKSSLTKKEKDTLTKIKQGKYYLNIKYCHGVAIGGTKPLNVSFKAARGYMKTPLYFETPAPNKVINNIVSLKYNDMFIPYNKDLIKNVVLLLQNKHSYKSKKIMRTYMLRALLPLCKKVEENRLLIKDTDDVTPFNRWILSDERQSTLPKHKKFLKLICNHTIGREMEMSSEQQNTIITILKTIL